MEFFLVYESTPDLCYHLGAKTTLKAAMEIGEKCWRGYEGEEAEPKWEHTEDFPNDWSLIVSSGFRHSIQIDRMMLED